MKKLYIWGAGEYAEIIYNLLDFNKCDFCGFIDKNINKIGKLFCGKQIISPEMASHSSLDYIIVSVFNSAETVIKDAEKLGVERKKLILFFKDELKYDFFNQDKLEIYKLRKENKRLKLLLENAPYELEVEKIPQIISNEKTFLKIKNEHYSLARFGDGEYEMIFGNERPWFQLPNKELARRLESVLTDEKPNVLIGLANQFGRLDMYGDEYADVIRNYFTISVRNKLMKYIDLKREYVDTYITRPYLIFKDREGSRDTFNSWKLIWENRDIIIVEGQYSRNGVGNDLFDSAKSVRRILCPEKNAFFMYDKIVKTIRENLESDEMILVSLGPTATVLAYELGQEGIQTIDIGQLDNEYEWYRMGATERSEIPGKSVSELSWWHEPEGMENEKYDSEIIERIE